MDIGELLALHGVRRAVIIDDAYRTVPLAKDIADGAEWPTFFDDVRPHWTLINEVHLGAEDARHEDLQRSDQFVAGLWGLQGRLPEELFSLVFASYIGTQEKDRAFLTSLEASLNAIGIEPVPVSQAVPEVDRQVSLVFADLFLGTEQTDADMREAITRLREIVSVETPPMIVLMSRSSRLDDKKDFFRDEAQLLGTMFRVAKKVDLEQDGAVERILGRMLRRRNDALHLARFLRAWDSGLDQARKSFMKTLRGIDLSDYSQVSQLLLAHEGQPLGSYLLDIYDRVLQYAIESDSETIDAAQKLSSIDLTSYSSTHLTPSIHLQELMLATIYQNPKRLAVSTTRCGAAVAFGDVLLKNPAAASAETTRDTKAVGAEAITANESIAVVISELLDAHSIPGTTGESENVDLGSNAQTEPVRAAELADLGETARAATAGGAADDSQVAEAAHVAEVAEVARVPEAVHMAEAADESAKDSPDGDECNADVMVVLTAACDLVRESSERVILIDGKLHRLDPSNWTYPSDSVSTAIFEVPGELVRSGITWNLKSMRTLSRVKVSSMLGNSTYKVVARLRESQALELQQKLFAQLGRVGLPAKIPASFRVSVQLAWHNPEQILTMPVVPDLEREGGVYFVGRDEDRKSACRLVLSERAQDALERELLAIPEVYPQGRQLLTLAKAQIAQLRGALEQGLRAPDPGSNKSVDIKIKVDEKEKVVGKLVLNAKEESLVSYRNIPFLILIRDLSNDHAAAGTKGVSAATPEN